MSKDTISSELLDTLRNALGLSIIKKEYGERASTLAISSTGERYMGAIVESDTNTFNISSEQVALTLSTISKDYKIFRIITLLESPNSQTLISPLVLKIIKDHSIRTGMEIEYTLINLDGEILLRVKSVDELIPFYKPNPIPLNRINESPSPFFKVLQENSSNISKLLKDHALDGLNRNFPLYDSASGYATAIITKSGNVYFAGQYSCPDKRLGLHSEVSALLAAFMSQDNEITHIGLVSTKYEDSPCHMCGNCRQFVSEMCGKFKLNPKLYLLAKNNDQFVETTLLEYLPSSWTSKKWQS